MTSSKAAPIVLIVFNRPAETLILFEEIRKLKPPQLFIVADGPREWKPGEQVLCTKVREIFDNIDWPCQVQKNYSSVNMGCKARVVSGLDWVFEHADKAVILEDDCIPSKSFFEFTNSMLSRYENDPSVGIVNGTTVITETDPGFDYYFSRFPQIWGWATWKRVWKKYDPDVLDWPNLRNTDFLSRWATNYAGVRKWRNSFDAVHQKRIDTWDSQLVFMLWKENLKSLSPTVNLITNIGFGPSATHTFDTSSSSSKLERGSLQNPIRHPLSSEMDISRDRITEIQLFEETSSDFIKRQVFNLLKKLHLDRIALSLYLKIKLTKS